MAQQLVLRDYQTEAIVACARYGMAKGRRALIVLPTGCGKTAIFSAMAAGARGRVLAIAHREELLGQAKRAFEIAAPSALVEIEQAEHHASDAADIVVASIQTLAVSPLRLLALKPESFSFIIVDEAHHAIARTYIEVLHHFGLAPDISDLTGNLGLEAKAVKREVRERFDEFQAAPDAPFLIGVTATPSRTDGKGLEYLFDEMVYSRSIKEMVDAGWLTRITGRRIKTDTDISAVRGQAGDFKVSQLADTVNTQPRNAQAVAAYLEYAEGRQALAFCVDVDHTIDMCEAFRNEGVKADYVVGDKARMMAPRADIIKAYQAGDINVLVNCMVLTEGFDAPETSALIMARPTKSSLLYTQMLGRGTRIAPGKRDLIVLDLADTAKAGVSNLNTMFGLPPKFELAGDDVLDMAGFVAEQLELPEDIWAGITDMEGLEQALAEFDPLTSAAIEDYLRTELSWVKTSFGYAISCPTAPGRPSAQMGLIVDPLGRVHLEIKQRGFGRQKLGQFPSVQHGIDGAESYAREQFEGYRVSMKDAKWRTGTPSAKQLEFAKKLGLQVPAGATKGQVATMIDARVAGGKKAE